MSVRCKLLEITCYSLWASLYRLLQNRVGWEPAIKHFFCWKMPVWGNRSISQECVRSDEVLMKYKQGPAGSLPCSCQPAQVVVGPEIVYSSKAHVDRAAPTPTDLTLPAAGGAGQCGNPV